MNVRAGMTRQQQRHLARRAKKEAEFKAPRHPFRRLIALAQDCAKAGKVLATAIAPQAQAFAVIAVDKARERLMAYTSRGHGRGGLSPAFGGNRTPSKYRPHQGARECERRRVGGFGYLRWKQAQGYA